MLVFATHKKMGVLVSRPVTDAPVQLVELWEDNCENAAVDRLGCGRRQRRRTAAG